MNLRALQIFTFNPLFYKQKELKKKRTMKTIYNTDKDGIKEPYKYYSDYESCSENEDDSKNKSIMPHNAAGIIAD